MKNLFNTLSNVSDFFNEKRNVYQRKAPKPISAKALDEALDQKLGDVLPEAKKDIVKSLTKAQLAKQEINAKLLANAQAKIDALRKGDYAYAKFEARGLKFKNAAEKKTALTHLVHELALLGPESNWKEAYKTTKSGKVIAAIEKDVVSTIDKALKKLPDYEHLLATYHIFSKYGTAEAGNRAKLVKEAWNKLVTPATKKTAEGRKILAYLGVGKPRKHAPSYEELLARLPKTPKRRVKKLTEAQRRALAQKEAKRVKAIEKRVAQMDVNKLIDEALPKEYRKPPTTKYAGGRTRRRP